MKPQRHDRLSRIFAKRRSAEGNDAPENTKKTAENDAGRGANGKNGRWNLKNLYPGLRSRALKNDQAFVEEKLAEFLDAYEGVDVNDMPGAELAEALAAYEVINNRKMKIYAYGELLISDNAANFEKIKPLQSWVGGIDQQLEDFLDQLADMSEEKLLFKLGAPAMSKYAPWLAQLRGGTPTRELSADIQTLSGVFDSIHTEGLSAYYQKHVIALEEKVAAVEKDTPEETRQAQADLMKQHSKRFATVLSTVIKTQDIDREWLGHDRHDQNFLDRNKLDADTADMLRETVKKSYISLSHRYYKWLADQHGVDVLPSSRLSDPVPGQTELEDLEYPWEQAEPEILSAFRKFSPKFANIAKEYFEGGYIDAAPHKGKAASDFTLPTGPDGHPYILTNFNEDIISLVVLAHELGHGIHMVLAEEAQGGLLSDTPETMAEIASVFSEMLMFDYLRGKTKDPDVERKLLQHQIEGLLESGMLQMAYFDFEKRVYESAQTGAPDAEEISDIWVDVLQEYYGPSVEIDDYQRYSWCMVPHFFEPPSFYVFSYSFAQGMANSLYKLYQETDDKPQFIEDYTNLLKAGMSADLKELLQPLGLDHTSQEFWTKGLELIEDYLNILESGTPSAIPTSAPSIADILGTTVPGLADKKNLDNSARGGDNNKKSFRFRP
ncbi:MAG: hypothetical protein HND56_02275 [Pseudomonadota bacterium]|nr:MAG: hypothetical protein HND56_02275 [Pseudomonadota bacterium]